MICETEAAVFFTKEFPAPYDQYLGVVTYERCPHCGFVFSRAHRQMSEEAWQQINELFHTYVEDPTTVNVTNQPPYLEQATLINVLVRNGLIGFDNALDWGGGFGTLARILKRYHDLSLPVYEKYMQRLSDDSAASERSEVVYASKDELTKYSCVVSSAVFEHVRERQQLDEISSLVAADGCMILHTVVCEVVPNDPNWFYLLPVHCAFHTNRSMELLMSQWGYSSSIYCVSAKSWILFRGEAASQAAAQAVETVNLEFQSQYLFYKHGFMDYWK